MSPASASSSTTIARDKLHWSDRLREIYGTTADAPASLNGFSR